MMRKTPNERLENTYIENKICLQEKVWTVLVLRHMNARTILNVQLIDVAVVHCTTGTE